LISANYGDSTLTVLTNNGGGGFGLYAVLGTGNSPAAVVAADVNGDGKVDLIAANYGNNSLTVLTNNGSGGFGLYTVAGVGAAPTSVAAADVNGDGKIDLISANEQANTLTVFTNEYGSTVNVSFSGAFTGSGAGLTNLPASAISGGVNTVLAVTVPGGGTKSLYITNGIIVNIQ
jgi:FlaG/FlaF family flagellin (archaellin)